VSGGAQAARAGTDDRDLESLRRHVPSLWTMKREYAVHYEP
jgi:hypothetical protein